jgi:hypothetical protein
MALPESDPVPLSQALPVDSDFVYEGPRRALQVANDMTASITQYLSVKTRYIRIVQNQIVLFEPAYPDCA